MDDVISERPHFQNGGNVGSVFIMQQGVTHAVIVTEEPLNIWLRRIVRHRIGDTVQFAFQPFRRKPAPKQWDLLMEDLRDLHRTSPLDLIVFDTLASFLPGQEESNAAAMTNLLRPLRDLAEKGIAIWLQHHPPKGRTQPGQSARGTGALPASVDTILEFHWDGPSTKESRRRKLLAWSRHEQTPREVLVELTNGGIDYAVVSAGARPNDDEVTRIVLDLLRAKPDLTAQEVRQSWPEGTAYRKPRTLAARLRQLTDQGRILRSGQGNRFSPYRYGVGAEQREAP